MLEGELYEFTPSCQRSRWRFARVLDRPKASLGDIRRATGRLSGTPDSEDVGNFTNIAISVSDGHVTATLRDFNITVDQIALGNATLSWMPPTENADGGALTDLAGYRIYYGRNPNNLEQSIVLDNPGLTRYVVENLTPGEMAFLDDIREFQRQRKRSLRDCEQDDQLSPRPPLTPPVRHARPCVADSWGILWRISNSVSRRPREPPRT